MIILLTSQLEISNILDGPFLPSGLFSMIIVIV